VLAQLAEDDWITVEGHTWRPDIKADMLGDVGDRDDRREGMNFDASDLLGG